MRERAEAQIELSCESVLSVPAREPRHSSQVDTVRPPATPSHNTLEQQTYRGGTFGQPHSFAIYWTKHAYTIIIINQEHC